MNEQKRSNDRQVAIMCAVLATLLVVGGVTDQRWGWTRDVAFYAQELVVRATGRFTVPDID
jgi:hypothetical protein